MSVSNRIGIACSYGSVQEDFKMSRSNSIVNNTNSKENTVKTNRSIRRHVARLGLALVGVGLFGSIMVSHVSTANAQSDMWPVSLKQVVDQFGVEGDPQDACFEIVRERGGYEVHGQAFDVHSLGSKMIPITFDVNRDKAMLWGPAKYVGVTPNSGGIGARYVLEPGQEEQIWTTGSCAQDGQPATGMSFYPGYPQEIGFQPHTGNQQPATVTNTVSNTSNTGANAGITDPLALAQTVGINGTVTNQLPPNGVVINSTVAGTFTLPQHLVVVTDRKYLAGDSVTLKVGQPASLYYE